MFAVLSVAANVFCQSAMPIIDYRTVPLVCMGAVIDMLRVVGRAVEVALKMSMGEGGLVSLLNADLGESVLFKNVVEDGVLKDWRNVRLHPEDAELAKELAIDVRQRLHDAGYAVLPCTQYGRRTCGIDVPQKDTTKKITMSHDLLLENIRKLQSGRVTCELKLRRVNGPRHLCSLRKSLREECDKIWAAVCAETPELYNGQILLLYCFPFPSGTTRSSKADVRLSSGAWAKLWGWGSVVPPKLAIAAPPIPRAPPPPPPPPPFPLAPRASPLRKRPCAEVSEDPRLQWFPVGQRTMASVSHSLVLARVKDVSKVGRLVDRGLASDTLGWSRWDVRKDPRASSTGGRRGGHPGWAATARVISDIHDMI